MESGTFEVINCMVFGSDVHQGRRLVGDGTFSGVWSSWRFIVDHLWVGDAWNLFQFVVQFFEQRVRFITFRTRWTSGLTWIKKYLNEISVCFHCRTNIFKNQCHFEDWIHLVSAYCYIFLLLQLIDDSNWLHRGHT